MKCIYKSSYLAIAIKLVIAACSLQAENQKAFVIKPVIDLVCQYTDEDPRTHLYKKIPFCGCSPKAYSACPRTHQLLFNEVVDILEERNDQVYISIPHLFYTTAAHNKPQTKYWTLKENLMPIEHLEIKKCNIKNIPQPLSFTHKNSETCNEHVITLIFPWHDPVTNQTFSAGTRFVLASNTTTNNSAIAYVFDKKTESFKETEIPLSCSLINNHIKSKNQKITAFATLLKKWANLPDGLIPYVLGGCSFTSMCKQNIFNKVEIEGKIPITSYFERPHYNQDIKTGFDCSGLVARAAQICSIPYFFKNTTTLVNNLQLLQNSESLENGDLLWIPGHVMIISDIANNKIIEARGYASGYGKVHEISLHELFKDINTYKDIVKTFFSKKNLQLLNSEGNVSSTINEMRLLKLRSVWNV